MVLVRRTRPLCLRRAWVFREHVWELCHFPSLQIQLPRSAEMKRAPPLPCHGASVRTFDTLGTGIVWALSTLLLKHKAWLFRGNHSVAPCIGSPCLVSDCTSYSPDKATHSFDRWPDSLCNLSQLLACLGFSHAGSGVLFWGGDVCSGPAPVSWQTGVSSECCYTSHSPLLWPSYHYHSSLYETSWHILCYLWGKPNESLRHS